MTAPTVAPSVPREERLTISAHDHDILTTAEATPRLGVFVDFMRAAGLAPLMLEAGPFTVFAPTERAFLKLSLRERDALLADPRRLTRIMRGHVCMDGVPPITDAPGRINTIDGDTLQLTAVDGEYRVGRARVVQTNIPASNGTIHAIDSILL